MHRALHQARCILLHTEQSLGIETKEPKFSEKANKIHMDLDEYETDSISLLPNEIKVDFTNSLQTQN